MCVIEEENVTFGVDFNNITDCQHKVLKGEMKYNKLNCTSRRICLLVLYCCLVTIYQKSSHWFDFYVAV